MLETLSFILPFAFADVNRGEVGVAVRVELLDSDDMEGAGETVRDDSADRAVSKGESTGEGA